ncbi:MAG: glutamine--tRNA ligase/YqeY domain fusion protein [Deltaproteobacteria bacterium]|nr:glutamine--tRNA ligase/YqeY domain fusion protein [Deltaproteobacteria bacterium]
MTSKTDSPRHFLNDIIDADLEAGRHQQVVTRFPPEPNGYAHIGHCKSICLNFGLAQEYGGRCHLRFDDTNPSTEDMEYVEAFKKDIRWLGFDWGEHLYFASDYFPRLYQFAEELIENSLAYVDSSSEDEIRAARGSLGVAGTHSPHRDRAVDENLDLFRRMKAGEFEDGAMVLRAKIDMAASNMKMRDPLLYRIRRDAHHYRTGNEWKIYPMYDFAHCLSDAIEGITHSICTLEFENNRELYDWIIDNLDTPANPRQYEFARLGLNYTVMSKRKLLQLVKDGHVSGWDDPRMPTIAGMRRRGYTPEALRNFAAMIGVAKSNSTVDVGKLEFSLRDDLNYRAPRVMAVLDPLEVVIDNYPEGKSESLTARYFPPDVGKEGERQVSFSRTLYIERSDFMKVPEKGFRRLSPGQEVRLRYAYVIRCDEVVNNDAGEVVGLRCSYDPETLGEAPKDRKVKGVIHWVDAATAASAEVRIYDRLFQNPAPDASGNFIADLNPDSLVKDKQAKVEASVKDDDPGTCYQFTRQGYFWRDLDSKPDALVFNRIVELRDSWAGRAEKAAAESKPAETSGSSKKDDTRPDKKSRAEYREIARQRDPRLAERFGRYQQLGLSGGDADVLSGELELGDFFEAALAVHDDAGEVSKWIVNDVLREAKETPLGELKFDAAAIGKLARMTGTGAISSSIAKKVFAILADEGGDPEAIVRDHGLEQVSDEGELSALVSELIDANPAQAEQYRGGKTGLIGFFVGQAMKKTGGKADPKLVKGLLEKALS